MNIRIWSWILVVHVCGCIGEVSSSNPLNKQDAKLRRDIHPSSDKTNNIPIAARDAQYRVDLPRLPDYGKPPIMDQGIIRRDQGGTSIKLTTLEKELFDAINAARSQKGLSPVTIEEHLLCAERKHVQDVVPTGSCGHIGTDGSTYVDRAKRCGYSASLAWQVAEIGAGAPNISSTPTWAVTAWANDPPHAKYLFHAQAKWVGVAAYSNCYYALFDCCVYP